MAKSRHKRDEISEQDPSRKNTVSPKEKTKLTRPRIDLSKLIIPISNKHIIAGILALIAMVFYANTFQNKFALDDDVVILRNDHVQAGIKGIPDLLNKDSFHGYLKKGTDFLPGGRYRPLSLITFAIEQSISKDNAFMGHLINVVLYGLSIGLLYLLLRNHFFKYKPDIAILSAFIFAILPIHTEVVANIKSRDEILSLIFIVLTLNSAMNYALNNKFKDLLLGLLYYSLTLLSKENGVVLILIIPLTMLYFTKLDYKSILVKSTGFLAVVIFYLVIRQSIIGGLKAEYEDLMTDPYLAATTIQKYCTIVYVQLKYLFLIFFPYQFSWDYSYNAIPYVNLTSPEFSVSIIVLSALLGYSVYTTFFSQNRNPIGYGLLFYFISMSLSANVLINIGAPMAERFTYQGTVGIAIAVAVLIYFGFEKLENIDLKIRRGVILAGLLVIAIPAFSITYKRNEQWYDSISVALADVITIPTSAKTNMSAGDASMAKGFRTPGTDYENRLTCFQNAVNYFNITLKITPEWKHAGKRMGEAYYEQAKISDSLGLIKKDEIAMKLFNSKDSANKISFNLLKLAVKWDTLRHNAWTNLGHMYARNNDKVNALNCFQQAVIQQANFKRLMTPNNESLSECDTSTYWHNLGTAHFELFENKMAQQGVSHLDSAAKFFEKSIKYGGNTADKWYDLGVVYYTAKKNKKAFECFTNALKINPNHQNAIRAYNLTKDSAD